MASKLVNIVKGFTLTVLQDGRLVKHRIEAGLQRLEKETADHWYTIAHSGDVPSAAQPDADLPGGEGEVAHEGEPSDTEPDAEPDPAEAGEAKEEADAKPATSNNGGNNNRSKTRG